MTGWPDRAAWAQNARRFLRDPKGTLGGMLGGAAAYPVLALAGLNLVDELDQAAYGLLGPEIVRHFAISPAMLGLAFLPAILLGMALPVVLGYLTDRVNRVRLSIVGALLWLVFAMATGVVPAFWMLVIVRMLSSIGRSVSGPTHNSLLSDYYDVSGRGGAFAIHQNANPVGSFLGFLVSGYLATVLGWQKVFLLLPLPGVIFVVLMLRLKEPPRGQQEQAAVADLEAADLAPVGLSQAIQMLRSIKSWRRYAWVWLFLAVGVASSLVTTFFLDVTFGVEAFGRGIILAAVAGLSVVGSIGGGMIAQRFLAAGRHDRLGRLITLTIIFNAVSFVALAFAPNLGIAVFIILFTTPLRQLAAVPVLLVLSAILPARIRGQGFGVLYFFFALGFLFVPIALAYSEAFSYRVGLLFAGPPLLVAALLAWTAEGLIGQDVERANKAGAAEIEVRRRRAAGQTIDLLEIVDLDVAYGDVQVLFGCNLRVRDGEMVALLGTNGAGKSTLLRGMSGVVTPQRGLVLFDGEDITGLTAVDTTARGIIHVPGGRGVFPGLTVERNLQLGTFLYRKDRDYMKSSFDDALELFPRLAERLQQPAGTLSGGEQQMVTLAQAFMAKPRILAIDELSLGLAPKVVEELLGVVRAINDAGVTVILVEQSVNIALTLADRAYFMEKGEVRFEGPAVELLERGDLVRSVFLAGAATQGSLLAGGGTR